MYESVNLKVKTSLPTRTQHQKLRIGAEQKEMWKAVKLTKYLTNCFLEECVSLEEFQSSNCHIHNLHVKGKMHFRIFCTHILKVFFYHFHQCMLHTVVYLMLLESAQVLLLGKDGIFSADVVVLRAYQLILRSCDEVLQLPVRETIVPERASSSLRLDDCSSK